MAERTDFEVVNALGVTVATFSDKPLAKRFVLKHAQSHGELHVEQVTRFEHRLTVYRPRTSRPPATQQGDA